VFAEEGFDSGEEASLRIPETAQHSKECFVSGGVLHPRNITSYPLYRQMPANIAVAAHAVHGRASTANAAEVSQGPLRGRTDARRNLNAEILREAQQQRRQVSRASSRHAIHLWPGMVMMRSRQLLFLMG
jgi:hypothetical protein